MKGVHFSSILALVVLFNGCFTTTSSKKEEVPRREFQTVEIIDGSMNDPFITNEFISDNNSFKEGSVYFSAALFLSDMGILETITKEQFEKYTEVIFSNFPTEGQCKEVIIPNVSLSQEDRDEKNAYLFITKSKNNDGKYYYLIESNIPIASIYAKDYDGYVMRLNTGFYQNKIPARWTSIMRINTNNDILLYGGVAYPSKSAPLIFTGTGIGSDVHMNSIISGQSTITDVKNALKEAVEKALQNTQAENQQQIDSMKFLEKGTYISLSAYSYIDSDIEDAKKYYILSEQVNVNIPEDTMGSRISELSKIMNYLTNVIGE
jgi:hypothetical protein